MPKTLAIVGNCQVGGLEKAFKLATKDIRPTPFFLAELGGSHDKVSFAEEMKTYDLVYAHQSEDPNFGIEALRSAGIGVKEIPVVSFPAFHPDMVYAQKLRADGGLDVLKSPVGENHSALILYGFHLGLNAEQIARLFCEDIYQTVGFFEAWPAAWEALAQAGKRAELPLESMMLSWSRQGPFMHTLNHPKVGVLADIARAIAKKEGAQLRPAASDAYLIDDLMTSTIWPIYPEIGRRLGIEGSQLFKRAGVTQFYDLEQMITESLAIYALENRDDVKCWRIDLWNFLPGVRDKFLACAGVVQSSDGLSVAV